MLKIAGSSGVHIDDVHKAMGITPGMSSDEVKKAKRKFALNNHPDRNPGKDSSHYTKIMSGFDDHYDQDHKRKPSFGNWGHQTHGSDEPRRGTREDSEKWRQEEADKRKRWEEEYAYRKAQREESDRRDTRRDFKDINRSAKTRRNINLAGSAGYGLITIGGHHLVQKHHERKGQHEEAAIVKKLKRRQMVGQGVGWLGGALLGHHVGKKKSSHFVNNSVHADHIRSAIGDDGIKNTIKAHSQEAAARVGSSGQFLGSIGASLASHKLSKQLKDHKDRRGSEERESSINRRRD
jgi:curved DNA-binding protein CbpA